MLQLGVLRPRRTFETRGQVPLAHFAGQQAHASGAAGMGSAASIRDVAFEPKISFVSKSAVSVASVLMFLIVQSISPSDRVDEASLSNCFTTWLVRRRGRDFPWAASLTLCQLVHGCLESSCTGRRSADGVGCHVVQRPRRICMRLRCPWSTVFHRLMPR